ncbi:MAG: ArnT family glycosyltransferase [Candidatus Limnocylindria bacterium]
MTARTVATPFPLRAELEAARTRLSALAVTIAVVVGAGLRLWGLADVGFNSDEAVYAGQAAALAGNATYAQFFAIFRAHPLLVQFLVSLLFQFGVNDVAPRLLAVAFGLATIPLTYALGAQLYSRRAGLVAAAIIAVMPYHVTVSRQILLDAPMAMFFLVAMLFLARYTASGAARWLYASAFAGGMAFLAKETGLIVVGVAIAFALMTPSVRISPRRVFAAAAVFIIAISPYPLSIAVAGASETARQFLIWQFLRRPNHTWSFYAEILPGAVGPILLGFVAVGLVFAVRKAAWQDRLIVAWLVVPLAFYQVWPVKGYQYLLPLAPAMALLAARTFEAPLWSRFEAWWRARRGERGGAGSLGFMAALATVMIVVSLTIPSVVAVSTTTTVGSLAGTGGLPGGREAGLWIRDNVPEGATFMTIGPTLSNLIQFYGQRRSLGLSVSVNQLHRNPAYTPIQNPDRAIRRLEFQYLAYDVWSAGRSPHFADVLRRYVEKFNGRLVHEQTAMVRDADGAVRERVVIQIYAVRP